MASMRPYLNSVAGTSLDAAGVRRTVEQLDPFVPFDEQTKYFVNKEGAEYYGNSMGAFIKSLEASGTIPAGITPEEIVWAAPMYDEMAAYKKKSEALFETAPKSGLSAGRRLCWRRPNSSTIGTISSTPIGSRALCWRGSGSSSPGRAKAVGAKPIR